jgi:HSP20 family molecular chaperone IbpA
VSTELDRTFDRLWRDFGLQRRRLWLTQNLFGRRIDRGIWAPRIEAFEKDDKFIVRAELPGIEKDNVEIELLD